MIRIVGVQRHEQAANEFLLLQNQGGLRVSLRGSVVMADQAVAMGSFIAGAHVFPDDVQIPPGAFVLLQSGAGEPRWAKTKDGALVYYSFMGRDRSVWSHVAGPIHVLSPHHSYTERKEYANFR